MSTSKRYSNNNVKINKQSIQCTKAGLNKNILKKTNNLYDGCVITKNIMLDISKKIGVQPKELFEELYYQLPFEWIKPLRNELYKKMILEIKNGNADCYLTDSSSNDNYSSETSSNYSS